MHHWKYGWMNPKGREVGLQKNFTILVARQAMGAKTDKDRYEKDSELEYRSLADSTVLGSKVAEIRSRGFEKLLPSSTTAMTPMEELERWNNATNQAAGRYGREEVTDALLTY